MDNAAIEKAIAIVCRQQDLPADLVHIRTAHYAAYRIVGTPYLVRARDKQSYFEHEAEMRKARLMAQADINVGTPADDLEEPLCICQDYAIGFWHWIDHI